MRDIVCLYHPEFVKSADLRNFGMTQPDLFNIERLVEQSLAAVGPYDFVDAAGYDFSDFSDSKTTTVVPDGRTTKTAIINSVENKIGSLRVVIYNPFKGCADFMFIPHKQVQALKEPCYGRSGGTKERLRARWNVHHDHYNYFDRFKLKTFEDLALAK
jgi:hypothetical protein